MQLSFLRLYYKKCSCSRMQITADDWIYKQMGFCFNFKTEYKHKLKITEVIIQLNKHLTNKSI